MTVSIFGPTNVKVNVVGNNFVVTWDAASGANCYDVIYTDSDNKTTWLHTNQTNKTIKISTKPGTYTFDVQSLYRPNGSTSNQTVGAHSQKVTYTLSLDAPKNVSVSSDKNRFTAEWDIVAGATTYYVVVKNSSGETVDSLFTSENKYSSSNRSVNYSNGRYSFYVTPYYRPNNSSTGQYIGKTSNAVTFELKECEHICKVKMVKEPTCNETGLRVLTCTECGYIYGETVDKKSHDFSDNSPNCKLCGTQNPNYVAPTPSNNPQTTTQPTTTTTNGNNGNTANTTTSINQNNYTTQPVSNTVATTADEDDIDDADDVENESENDEEQSETSQKPKSTSIKSLKKGKKQIKTTWKKVSGVKGYQVQVATDKKFKKNKKTVTIKKQKTTSTTIKKLKSNKKYYVRVRTYKTVNGKKVYSSWSKVKTIKTK